MANVLEQIKEKMLIKDINGKTKYEIVVNKRKKKNIINQGGHKL